MIQTTDKFDIGSILENDRDDKYTVIGLTGDFTDEIRAFYYYPIMYSVEVAKAGLKLDINFIQNIDTKKAFSPAYLDGTTLIDDARGVLDYLTGKITKNKFIQQRLYIIYNTPTEQYFAYSVKRNKIEFVHYGNDKNCSL